MAKAKKVKVDMDKISQVHGALPEAKSVQDIMGYTTGYKEASIEEYQTSLEAMTDTDLHEHAVEVGIVPTHNRVLLIDKLERQFITAQNKYLYRNNSSKMSKENEETLRKLLRGAV